VPAPVWEIAYADVIYDGGDPLSELYAAAHGLLTAGWEPYAVCFLPMVASGLEPPLRMVMWFRRKT